MIEEEHPSVEDQRVGVSTDLVVVLPPSRFVEQPTLLFDPLPTVGGAVDGESVPRVDEHQYRSRNSNTIGVSWKSPAIVGRSFADHS